MVTTDELIAEVAEAEAAGLRAEEINELRGQVEGAAAVGGMGMAYEVPDADKAAFVPAWRLSIDHAGVERGTPVKLAKGALALYLSKKRPIDGGRLFTLKMPEHLEAPRTFPCFAAPNMCKHKSDTKMNLITHILAAHPQEASHFEEEIAILRKSANKDNTALQSLVQQMADTPDPGLTIVAEPVREAYNATVPEVAAPEITTLSLTAQCSLCPWPQDSAKWAGRTPTDQALKMHIFAKHKTDIE